MKVYLEEFLIPFDGGILIYAAIKEAVSDALLMSAPIDTCMETIHKRNYKIVNKSAYMLTDEYKEQKAINLLTNTITKTYH